MADGFEDPFEDEFDSPAPTPVVDVDAVVAETESAVASVAVEPPEGLPEERGEMTAAVINPLIDATRHVFRVSLKTEVTRSGLHLYNPAYPIHPVSSVIELTGAAYGAVCLNLPRRTAFQIVARMTGATAEKDDAAVRDAVGEITNMIAGNAKAKFEHLKLRMGLPRVLLGDAPMLPLPAFVAPVRAEFRSEIGDLGVIFGLRRAGDRPEAAGA